MTGSHDTTMSGPATPAEDSLVLVRRDMLASACAAIRLKKDAPVTLEYLRAASLASDASPRGEACNLVPPPETYGGSPDEPWTGKMPPATHTAPATVESEALRALYEWYDRDGSVGGASEVFEQYRAALAPATEGRKG